MLITHPFFFFFFPLLFTSITKIHTPPRHSLPGHRHTQHIRLFLSFFRPSLDSLSLSVFPVNIEADQGSALPCATSGPTRASSLVLGRYVVPGMFYFFISSHRAFLLGHALSFFLSSFFFLPFFFFFYFFFFFPFGPSPPKGTFDP